MKRDTSLILLIFIFLLILMIILPPVLLAACQPSPHANPNLILATTTSTQDTGLLDVLIPLFEEKTGYRVQTIAVGSGQALKMGEEGNADVLLVHAPSCEVIFMENGFGSDRRLVMHTDFILVGPADDPAGMRGAANAVQALQRIGDSGATFVSRGDDSGTHMAELDLWTRTSIKPESQPWYLESGQGMGATLMIASERGAYTLSDRATYLANRENLALEVLFEGDALLLNVYHVIVVNHDLWSTTNLEGATALAEFLTDADTQEMIARFGVEEFGQPLFFPDAGKTDAFPGLP